MRKLLGTQLSARAVRPSIAALLLAAGVVGASGAWANTSVTVVLSEEPEVLEPCEATRSTVGRVVKQNIAETFTEINPADGTITPRLATAWSQVDNLTWRFELRKGVKFHDGADFDAAAAVYAIERTMDKSMDCETRTKFFGGIKLTASATGSHVLEIKTEKPVPIMPVMAGTIAVVSPNTPKGKATRTPIGTGPYKFVSWQPGKDVQLERFDGYWGTKPPVTKATFIWRGESAVRAAMVKTGEADIAPNIAVQDANDSTMDFSYPNSETSRLRIDTTRPPLNNRNVRMALNLAIDRNALRGSIFSKDVIPATQLVVASINGHNPELKVWPYDLAKAKQLLAKARSEGANLDQEIVLIGRTNIYPNATEVMEATMAMYQELGLNVKLKMYEVGEWLDLLLKPYAEDRGPALQQSQHDNNNGDAVFTVYT
ncbi:MAG: peptide ABC transporter substrate-binding protein, partial [Chromatiales bacterium]|nr:peptide ABC transporter substrate-binding protein [Chromatiales bacterium]